MCFSSPLPPPHHYLILIYFSLIHILVLKSVSFTTNVRCEREAAATHINMFKVCFLSNTHTIAFRLKLNVWHQQGILQKWKRVKRVIGNRAKHWTKQQNKQGNSPAEWFTFSNSHLKLDVEHHCDLLQLSLRAAACVRVCVCCCASPQSGVSWYSPVRVRAWARVRALWRQQAWHCFKSRC